MYECDVILYSAAPLPLHFAYHGPGESFIHLDDVDCRGDEESLLDCLNILVHHNCRHTEDAGVDCSRGGKFYCVYIGLCGSVLPSVASADRTCLFNGTTYQEGDVFPLGDGCNNW